MPHRTQLIDIPSGLMATLNIASAYACLDSLIAACDQYQQRFGRLPECLMLSESLTEVTRWLLRRWCDERQIVIRPHYGDTAWLLTLPPDREEAIR